MRTMQIGKWQLSVGDLRPMSPGPVRVLEDFLSGPWREAVLAEVRHPWLGSERGVPSPIVKIDMAPAAGDEAVEKIYEVEVRPAGLGVSLSILPEWHRGLWRGILDGCGCEGLVRIDSAMQDDALAAELLGLPYAEAVDASAAGAYWVRASESVPDAAGLEDISLTPIRDDGDKMYLVRLGMADILGPAEEPDWQRPFVAKPMQGSRCEGVEVWLPKPMRAEHVHGWSKEGRIRRTLAEIAGRTFIVQKFIPPAAEEIGGKRGGLIWRIFFGWQDCHYRFIGGMWSWRPNLKNHGATDTVQGALCLA